MRIVVMLGAVAAVLAVAARGAADGDLPKGIYWVDNGDGGVQQVPASPDDVTADRWEVWLYQPGVAPGGTTGRWGVIEGTSAADVTARWQQERDAAIAVDEAMGVDPAHELWTYLNPLGPIAVYRTHRPKSTIQEIGERVAKIAKWADGLYRLYRRVTGGKPGRFEKAGKLFRDYATDMMIAARHVHELEQQLQSMTDLRDFGASLDAVEAELNRVSVREQAAESDPIVVRMLAENDTAPAPAPLANGLVPTTDVTPAPAHAAPEPAVDRPIDHVDSPSAPAQQPRCRGQAAAAPPPPSGTVTAQIADPDFDGCGSPAGASGHAGGNGNGSGSGRSSAAPGCGANAHDEGGYCVPNVPQCLNENTRWDGKTCAYTSCPQCGGGLCPNGTSPQPNGACAIGPDPAAPKPAPPPVKPAAPSPPPDCRDDAHAEGDVCVPNAPTCDTSFTWNGHTCVSDRGVEKCPFATSPQHAGGSCACLPGLTYGPVAGRPGSFTCLEPWHFPKAKAAAIDCGHDARAEDGYCVPLAPACNDNRTWDAHTCQYAAWCQGADCKVCPATTEMHGESCACPKGQTWVRVDGFGAAGNPYDANYACGALGNHDAPPTAAPKPFTMHWKDDNADVAWDYPSTDQTLSFSNGALTAIADWTYPSEMPPGHSKQTVSPSSLSQLRDVELWTTTDRPHWKVSVNSSAGVLSFYCETQAQCDKVHDAIASLMPHR